MSAVLQNNDYKFSREILRLLPVLLIIFIVFAPVLKCEFVQLDDYSHLLSNEDVRSLEAENITSIFKHTVNDTYIPLTVLSWAVEYHFVQYRPFLYHLNNLILHLIVVILVFDLARRMGVSGRAAGLTALLFGIHPMHVESVAWVTERKDVLYSFFYLLSLIQYWRFLKSQRLKPYIFSIGFCVLSVLSKGSALTIPLILFLMDWFYGRKRSWTLLVDKIPYILAIVPITLITFSANRTVFDAQHGMFAKGLMVIWNFIFYIQKFVWPVTLNTVYHFPQPVKFMHWPYAVSVAVFLILCAMVVRFRKNRWFIFSIAFYAFGIFYLLGHDDQGYANLITERYMYLPMFGFCMLCGIGADRAIDLTKGQVRRLMAVIFSLVFIVTMFGLTTYRQIHVWKDDNTFFSHVFDNNPNDAFVFYMKGKLLHNRKRYEEAVVYYSRSVNLRPDRIKAYFYRGQIFNQFGQYELAIKDFNMVGKLNERYPSHNKFKPAEALNSRGVAFANLNNHDKALIDFNAAIEMAPVYAKAFNNRGLVNIDLHRYDKALKDFNRSVELDNKNASTYNNRAKCYLKLGKLERAQRDYEKASQIEAKIAK